VQFAVDWPEPLRSVDEWVATPSFVVEQQFDRPLDGLQPGDAIRQTIRYVALDVPAMMLPEYTSYALDGIAVYRQTPTVRDQVDRGVYRAERIEQLTWVIEAGGEYAIPPREYAWWDTTQQQLKLITLPGFSLQAGLPDAETTPSEVDDGWREVTQSASRPIALAFIALALAVLIWIRRRRMVVEASDARSTTTLDWRKRFQRAVADQDVTLMVSTLYAWYDHQVTDFDGCLRPYLAVAARDEARVALEQLLVAAFAAESGTLPAHSAVRALCINNDRMPVAGSTAYAVDADLR